MSINQINSLTLEERVQEIIKESSSLREVTYSYLDLTEDMFFNETIFIDYLGLPQSLKNLETFNLYIKNTGLSLQDFFSNIKLKTEEKLDADISLLRSFLSSEQCIDKNQTELIITALEFTKNAIDFELETAGYETGLSVIEEEIKNKKQEEYDEILFGRHVSKDIDYMKDAYSYTHFLLENNSEHLNPLEIRLIKNGLEIVERQIQKLSGRTEVQIPKFTEEVGDSDFKELSEIKIPKEDYIKIFDLFFEISDVKQRSKLGNYSSFYDGDDFYGIPSDVASYESKTLKEILELGAHETGHYINLKVTQERNEFKSKGDMLKEEGLATLTEKLISGVPIEDINYMSFAGPSVVLSRLMDGEQYKKFHDAYFQLLYVGGVLPNKRDTITQVLRKKRGFSKRNPGGPNKDASYSLGLKQVLDYVSNGDQGSIKNLFGGKISMNEVKSGNKLPHDFSNKYIHHILLSELIFFYLRKKGEKPQDLHNLFTSYMKEKYKHFDLDFNFFDESIRFCFKNRRKVLEILSIVKRSS